VLASLSTALVVSYLVSACDSNFTPFSQTDNFYTLLGYLDTDADTQYVRVIPFRATVERQLEPTIDAVVRSIDLTGGSTVVWSDSLVSFPDSTYGHVFWAVFSAKPEHTYRVEVQRSDGAVTSAETTVPARPGDPETVYGALNQSSTNAPMFWPGVNNVVDEDAYYEITEVNCLGTPSPALYQQPPEYSVRVRYEQDRRGRSTAAGWRFEFDFFGDKDILSRRYGFQDGFCAILYNLEVRIATPSAEFDPPGGVWDRELLIQPGSLSNVEGGLGFVGSVSRNSASLLLYPNTMLSLGYL